MLVTRSVTSVFRIIIVFIISTAKTRLIASQISGIPCFLFFQTARDVLPYTWAYTGNFSFVSFFVPFPFLTSASFAPLDFRFKVSPITPSVIRSDNRSSAFHISSLILFLTLFVTFATYKTHTRYQGLTFFSSFIFFFFFFFFYFRRVFRAISGRYIEAEISLHTLLLSLPLLVCPSIKVTRESMAEADAVTVSYAARGENNSLAREFRSVSRRESRPNGRFACRLENGCTSETH